VEHAKLVLGEFDQLTKSVEEYNRAKDSSCTIGILPSFSNYAIPEILSGFRSTYPQVEIKLAMEWSGQLIEMLLQEKLDLAFVNADEDLLISLPDSMEAEPFLEDHLVVVCSQTYHTPQKGFLTVEDLEGIPFLTSPSDATIAKTTAKLFETYHVRPNEVCVCTSIESLINLIRSNMGVSIMSSGIARQYDDIQKIPLKPDYHIKTALVYQRNKKKLPALRLFLHYIHGTGL
jgi:DNA-binding transcriptional LysR family regulator